jgi:hypothetical protein
MPPRPTLSLWSAAYPRLVAIALRWTYKSERDVEGLAQQAERARWRVSPRDEQSLRRRTALRG